MVGGEPLRKFLNVMSKSQTLLPSPQYSTYEWAGLQLAWAYTSSASHQDIYYYEYNGQIVMFVVICLMWIQCYLKVMRSLTLMCTFYILPQRFWELRPLVFNRGVARTLRSRNFSMITDPGARACYQGGDKTSLLLLICLWQTIFSPFGAEWSAPNICKTIRLVYNICRSVRCRLCT